MAKALSHNTRILKRPRITEKATVLSGKNVYAFEVDRDANKKDVMQAVKTLYGVKPVGARIVTIPAKSVERRGRIGRTVRSKKAYVYLKKGDTIEFV